MQGRFYLALAFLSLAGLAPSVVWAFAILFSPTMPGLRGQFVAFLLPLAVMLLACWPRNEAERLLQNSGLGLDPSNRRRALASCFGPYRPRGVRLRNLRVRGVGKALTLSLPLLALCLLTWLVLPLAFFFAFLFALRRAAWLGDRTAQAIEQCWFDLRGPERAAPAKLAGAGRHR